MISGISQVWENQDYFVGAAQGIASETFDLLDPNLNPYVFLVGVPIEEDPVRTLICTDSSEQAYPPEAFSQVRATAIIGSTPESWNQAMEHALAHADAKCDCVSFSSYPLPLNGYMVYSVLQFCKPAYQSYYSLRKEWFDGVHYYGSLLAAATEYFLDQCVKSVESNMPGIADIAEHPGAELIRMAARDFMRTPARAAGNPLGDYLIDVYNTVSSMRYEGAEGIGRILLAAKEHPSVEVVIALHSPVRVDSYRGVRKLLELSSQSGDLCLLSDPFEVYGIGRRSDQYDQDREDLFAVSFRKHYSWDLAHGKHVLMQVEYGQPSLPKQRMDATEFVDKALVVFPDLGHGNSALLWSFVEAAIQQRRGAMLVISNRALAEAERLQNQATRVKPVQMTRDLITQATAIDGAVLMEPSGVCHAIGVVLDGLACDDGDPSRGARYNSAVRYLNYTQGAQITCLIVVVSEDGMINLLPQGD